MTNTGPSRRRGPAFVEPGADIPGESTAPAPPTARVENAVSIAILCAMAVLPLLEIVGRHLWRTGVPGSAMFVQHGTLWIAFLGAAIAAREGNLLAIGAAADLLPARFRASARLVSSAVAAAVAALLCVAGVSLVQLEREGGSSCSPISPCGSPRR